MFTCVCGDVNKREPGCQIYVSSKRDIYLKLYSLLSSPPLFTSPLLFSFCKILSILKLFSITVRESKLASDSSLYAFIRSE